MSRAARRCVGVLLVLALAQSGCSMAIRRVGSDRFLVDPPNFLAGETTAVDVARALGPPSWIRRWERGLVFVYRHRREVETGLVLTFYLNLFSRGHRSSIDATYVAVFDAEDRLLHAGASGAPSTGWARDLGLD